MMGKNSSSDLPPSTPPLISPNSRRRRSEIILDPVETKRSAESEPACEDSACFFFPRDDVREVFSLKLALATSWRRLAVLAVGGLSFFFLRTPPSLIFFNLDTIFHVFFFVSAHTLPLLPPQQQT